MQWFIIALAGVLGAIVGSFLSVVGTRVERGEDIVWQRSHCPDCGSKLGVKELVPLVSFLWQRGRCRHCGHAIGRHYPFLELVTAGVFAGVMLRCASTFFHCFWLFPVPLWWFFLALLVLIAFVDYRSLTIPEEMVALGFLLMIVARAIFAPVTLGPAALGTVVGGGFFWFLVRVSQERWLGLGDAEVGALVGGLLGFPLVGVALLVSALVGGVWGLGLILTGKKKLGEQIAYAPFLALGGVVALLGSPWPRFFL